MKVNTIEKINVNQPIKNMAYQFCYGDNSHSAIKRIFMDDYLFKQHLNLDERFLKVFTPEDFHGHFTKQMRVHRELLESGVNWRPEITWYSNGDIVKMPPFHSPLLGDNSRISTFLEESRKETVESFIKSYKSLFNEGAYDPKVRQLYLQSVDFDVLQDPDLQKFIIILEKLGIPSETRATVINNVFASIKVTPNSKVDTEVINQAFFDSLMENHRSLKTLDESSLKSLVESLNLEEFRNVTNFEIESIQDLTFNDMENHALGLREVAFQNLLKKGQAYTINNVDHHPDISDAVKLIVEQFLKNITLLDMEFFNRFVYYHEKFALSICEPYLLCILGFQLYFKVILPFHIKDQFKGFIYRVFVKIQKLKGAISQQINYSLIDFYITNKISIKKKIFDFMSSIYINCSIESQQKAPIEDKPKVKEEFKQPIAGLLDNVLENQKTFKNDDLRVKATLDSANESATKTGHAIGEMVGSFVSGVISGGISANEDKFRAGAAAADSAINKAQEAGQEKQGEKAEAKDKKR